MNLIYRNIQVGDMKINSTVTNEMITDLKNLKSLYRMFYEYKYSTVDETLVISKYFTLDYIEGDYIYYNMTNKTLRKIKLLILSKSEISEVLKKIIKESIYCSVEDVMTRKISRELSREIDREILKKLMRLK